MSTNIGGDSELRNIENNNCAFTRNLEIRERVGSTIQIV